MAGLLDVSKGKSRRIGAIYEATECLGTGRFSEVYKAFDSSSQADVALKIYLETDERSHEEAAAEYRTVQQLSDLNTDFFPKARNFLKTRISNANHPVIVMEFGQYVEDNGRKRVVSLYDLIPDVTSKQGPAVDLHDFWCESQLYGWMTDLCGAVRLLHDQDIVHRDLKPSNVLVKRTAGGTVTVPFILDFNSSVRQHEGVAKGGTERYLPPEVRSGSRRTPSVVDDLWAVAALLWEMFFGIRRGFEGKPKPHAAIGWELPKELVDVLRKALSTDPQGRYHTAAELYDAIRQVLPSPSSAVGDTGVTFEELTWARERASRLRNLAMDELAGENELPVSKEVRERVKAIYSYLPDDTTQAYDIESDLITLGPRAIPVILEEAHRLAPETDEFHRIANAVCALAERDTAFADKCLAYYCMSSQISTRCMCRELCRRMELYPPALAGQLVNDGGLFLPDERVDLADLCIRYSKDEHAILELTQYMCKEYILDKNRYVELKTTIASRMGEIQFKDKALLLVQDTETHIWQDLPEFRRLSASARSDKERGLLQVMADGFASMGDEALVLLKSNKVPRRCQQNSLPVWRTFARKLAQNHPPARAWLQAVLLQNPGDPDLKYALQDSSGDSVVLPPLASMESYLSQFLATDDTPAFNKLRFAKGPEVFQLIRKALATRADLRTRQSILRLLDGFESRRRVDVVGVLLHHWDTLSAVDYGKAVEILTTFDVPFRFLEDAKGCLGRGLTTKHVAEARHGLDRLLG